MEKLKLQSADETQVGKPFHISQNVIRKSVINLETKKPGRRRKIFLNSLLAGSEKNPHPLELSFEFAFERAIARRFSCHIAEIIR